MERKEEMTDIVLCRQPDEDTGEPCKEPGIMDVTIQLSDQLTLNTLICEKHYNDAAQLYGEKLTLVPPRNRLG